MCIRDSNFTIRDSTNNRDVLVLTSSGKANFYDDITVGGDLDASAGQSLTGWHTQDKIWVMPSDFIENDDSSTRNLALVDSGGELRVMNAELEAYVNIPIPSGYKATHFRLNGTSFVSVVAYYSDCTTSSATLAHAPQTKTTNTEHALTAVEANDSTGRYMILKWSASHVNHRLYGGYVKIAKI